MILVFVHDDYYPIGGANDLVLIANDIEDAELEFFKHPEWTQNAHAYDTNKNRIVRFWKRGYEESLIDNPWEPAEDWFDEDGYRTKVVDVR